MEIRSDLAKTQSGCYVFFDYNQKIVRDLIWRLKYKGSKDVALVLIPFLYDHLLEAVAEIKQFSYSKEKTLIVPVPLHKKRQRQRGFNQALVLAQTLVNMDKENFELGDDVLERKINTQAQAKIKRQKDRLKNVKGAFVLKNKEKINKRLVIILDDVTTTGATLDECRKTLLENQSAKVIKMALASRDKMW